MDDGYSLFRSGWASQYIKQNVSKAEIIGAIEALEAELEQLEDCVVMDDNIVLVIPDGTEFWDASIMKWLKDNKGKNHVESNKKL